MVKIRLFCNAGMSTSLLVSKMIKAAEERGLDVDIIAYGAGEFEQRINEAQVALIGPQISYRKGEMSKIAAQHNVPLEVIPAQDYGMVRGDNVLDLALKLIEQNA